MPGGGSLGTWTVVQSLDVREVLRTYLNWQKISAFSGDIPDVWRRVTRNMNCCPILRCPGSSEYLLELTENISVFRRYSWCLEEGHSQHELLSNLKMSGKFWVLTWIDRRYQRIQEILLMPGGGSLGTWTVVQSLDVQEVLSTYLNWQKISAYSGDIADAWRRVTRNMNCCPILRCPGSSEYLLELTEDISIFRRYCWCLEEGHSEHELLSNIKMSGKFWALT